MRFARPEEILNGENEREPLATEYCSSEITFIEQTTFTAIFGRNVWTRYVGSE